jgi:DNA-binding IclR family transcriptional regulator
MRKQALQILSERPLTLRELADAMGVKEKKAFNLLKSLFERGAVKQFKDDDQRRYRALLKELSLEDQSPIDRT